MVYTGGVDKVRSVGASTAQVVGALVAVCGLYLLAGLAWALLVAGVAVVVVGALHEGGRV